jgi:hypothetical protein
VSATPVRWLSSRAAGHRARPRGLYRAAVQGAHGAALTDRPAHPRPRPRRATLRLRVHPRDVRAEGQAPLGLLRPPRPPRRPARRQARRDHRRQGRHACINAIHHDVRFTKAIITAARAQIDDLAAWLGLEVTGQPTVRHPRMLAAIWLASHQALNARRRPRCGRLRSPDSCRRELLPWNRSHPQKMPVRSRSISFRSSSTWLDAGTRS